MNWEDRSNARQVRRVAAGFNNVASVVKLTNVRNNGFGSLQFSLNGAVGSNYVIQVSTNLVNWSPFSTNVIPVGGFVIITDTNMTTSPRRFYRIAPLSFGTASSLSGLEN